MSELRLGMIGVSQGNGHPWSWAAICNGYDPDAMAACPYPAIPAYLAEHRFPEERLPGVSVTTIWTPDDVLSRKIARAARIDTVVTDPLQMISDVDGVLLARDDMETRISLALPFLEAGLPVYVDKPLAIDVEMARQLFSAERWEGQLFSCTALRYAEELRLTPGDAEAIGGVLHVTGTVPKSWETYGVHAVEPALALLETRAGAPSVTTSTGRDRRIIEVEWPSGHSATFSALGSRSAPISLLAIGSRDWRWLPFRDSFNAFREALATFADVVRQRYRAVPMEETLEVVAILEAGRDGE